MIGPCASACNASLAKAKTTRGSATRSPGNPRPGEPVIPRDERINVFLTGESAGSSFLLSRRAG